MRHAGATVFVLAIMGLCAASCVEDSDLTMAACEGAGGGDTIPTPTSGAGDPGPYGEQAEKAPCPNVTLIEEEPEPETPGICGNVYWCCAQLVCKSVKDGHEFGLEWYDIPICPSLWKKANTRSAAFNEVWVSSYMMPALAEAQIDAGSITACHFHGSNCHENAIGNPDRCAFYPAGPK